MRLKQEEWLLVSSLSLILLVGCTQEDKKPTAKPMLPAVISTGSQEKPNVAYAPEIKKDLAKATPKADKKKKLQFVLPLSRPNDESFVMSETLKPVPFALHHSQLDAEAQTLITANADWLKSQPPYLIQVVGVTDPRGSFARNQRLAERRAMIVREAYVAQGIPAERILIAAKVMDDGDCAMPGEDCFNKARRADTKIEHKALAQR